MVMVSTASTIATTTTVDTDVVCELDNLLILGRPGVGFGDFVAAMFALAVVKALGFGKVVGLRGVAGLFTGVGFGVVGSTWGEEIGAE